jgi:hypothetical protein
LGSSPITIEVGTNYSDAGATATDNYDGNITASLVVANTVNTTRLGAYTVTYTVSDNAGNAAVPAVRTVNVVDTTKPVITLLGSSPIAIEVGSNYSDAGATATDNYDGNITASLVIASTVNTGHLGTYTVTYTVSDRAGNAAIPIVRTVHVVDNTKPVITLLGQSVVTIELKTAYVDAGATALDNYDGNLTAQIVKTSNVDVTRYGTYFVTYNVKDSSGNTATSITRTVKVADITKPVITLKGSATMTVQVFGKFTDPGATARDNKDGNINSKITAVSTVKTSVVGTYTVTYTVSDAAGNAATPVVRTVKVVDTVKPVIKLVGSASISIKRNTTYVDAGATATDNYDGAITSRIVTVNPVNTSKTGTYTITYNVKDSSGNAATQLKRTVKVTN